VESRARLLLLMATLVCGTVLGLALSRVAPEPGTGRQLELLSFNRELPEFSLESAAGPVGREQLSGDKWHLVVFGYTHCPDVCPTTLAELAALMDASEGVPLNVLFVSVDPARDTPQSLARYVGFFAQGMIGATGDRANLESLSSALGVRFEVRTVPGSGGAAAETIVAHSNTIALIDSRGRVRGLLRPGFDQAAASREIRDIVGASE
jgi:protein SCO1/2